jgi:hypothetical protein
MKARQKHVRRSFLLGLLVSPLCGAYGDERSGPPPPEIVQVENVRVEEGAEIIIVGNDNGRYVLSCNMKASGCMTPLPAVEYFVFKKNTRWKFPAATEFTTLKYIQDWTESYFDAENIGLFPKDDLGEGRSFGVYIFESWLPRKQNH